jgi:DNA uptake protein ComE-like DNA-binding protein
MSRKSSVILVTAFAIGILAASVALAQTSTPAAGTSAPAAKATTPAHTSTAKKPATPKVDLNTATKEQLQALPGVSESLADRIIAARPFKAKNDLVSKNLMTKAEYEKVSSHVMVKETKETKEAKPAAK